MKIYAPIAQLVEHLTLNQGVPGSSPCWCTIYSERYSQLGCFSFQHLFFSLILVGINSDEGPPVPIPNTVVKLIYAENTLRVTARENRSMPTSFLRQK